MNLNDMSRRVDELARLVDGEPDATRSSVQLRQDRAALVEKMRHVVDGAERANRNLNADERRTFDNGEAEVRKLGERIEQKEAEEEREAADARPLGGSPGSPGGGFRLPWQRDRETGVALTRDQSLASHVRSRGYAVDGDRELRFGQMVRGMLTGDWRGADPERRALLESNAGSGGVLVPAPLSARVLDVARNEARVMRAGAQTVPMDSSTLKIARQTGDPSLAWHTEGAQISESDLTFDAVTLKAKTLPCLVKLSMEILEDVDNLDDIVSQSVGKAMALELDRVALRGSGVDPEPEGIRNTTGVTVLDADAAGGADGAPATWGTLIRAVAAVRGNNYVPSAAIHSVRTEVDLGSQTDSTGQYLAVPPLLEDVSRLDSNQVPNDLTHGASTDASEQYVGAWRELLVGMRTTFTVQPLNELYADTGERGILCHLRADVALAHAGAFAVVDGITPAG